MVALQHQATPPEAALPWFAIRVRSNHEQVAVEHLRARGFEEFAPSYKSERKWSDRTKVINRPLFPGYVFSRLSPSNRLPVLSIPGVVGLVSFAGAPSAIPDDEIERVRKMVNSGLPVAPFPFLSRGEPVIMERGPLMGLEGIVQETKGVLRLIISINLLQRSVCVEVDRSWVRPATQSDTASRLTHGEWVQTKSLFKNTE